MPNYPEEIREGQRVSARQWNLIVALLKRRVTGNYVEETNQGWNIREQPTPEPAGTVKPILYNVYNPLVLRPGSCTLSAGGIYVCGHDCRASLFTTVEPVSSGYSCNGCSEADAQTTNLSTAGMAYSDPAIRLEEAGLWYIEFEAQVRPYYENLTAAELYATTSVGAAMPSATHNHGGTVSNEGGHTHNITSDGDHYHQFSMPRIGYWSYKFGALISPVAPPGEVITDYSWGSATHVHFLNDLYNTATDNANTWCRDQLLGNFPAETTLNLGVNIAYVSTGGSLTIDRYDDIYCELLFIRLLLCRISDRMD